MFCPQCESEYVDGVAECPECEVALVELLPNAAVPKRDALTAEPALAFSSYDAGLVAIAKSILASSGIEYGVIGEEVQDLFGYGRFPTGGNVLMGPIKLIVAADDGADATALLSVLAEDAPMLASDAEALDEFDGPVRRSSARTVANTIAALLLLGILGEIVWLFFLR